MSRITILDMWDDAFDWWNEPSLTSLEVCDFVPSRENKSMIKRNLLSFLHQNSKRKYLGIEPKRWRWPVEQLSSERCSERTRGNLQTLSLGWLPDGFPAEPEGFTESRISTSLSKNLPCISSLDLSIEATERPWSLNNHLRAIVSNFPRLEELEIRSIRQPLSWRSSEPNESRLTMDVVAAAWCYAWAVRLPYTDRSSGSYSRLRQLNLSAKDGPSNGFRVELSHRTEEAREGVAYVVLRNLELALWSRIDLEHRVENKILEQKIRYLMIGAESGVWDVANREQQSVDPAWGVKRRTVPHATAIAVWEMEMSKPYSSAYGITSSCADELPYDQKRQPCCEQRF